MPREYRHIEQYEKEIIELKEKGLTKREMTARWHSVRCRTLTN